MMNRTVPTVILWVLIGIGALISLVSIIGMAALASPEAMGLGLVGFVAYLVGFTLLFRHSGLWPSTGGWLWYIAAVLWGSCASMIPPLITGGPLMELVWEAGWDRLVMSYGGAYPEEIIKAFGVLLLFGAFPALRRPWHGFLAGMAIGLGFELIENITYVVIMAQMDPQSDLEGAAFTLMLRFVAGPLLHGALTGVAGAGIGWAMWTSASASVARRVGVALGALLFVFAIHFAWNYMHTSETSAVITYALICLILYPVVIWLWMRFRRQAKEDHGYPWVITEPITSVAQLPPPVIVAS